MLLGASALRPAHPGADLPRPGFVDELQAQLEQGLAPATVRGRLTRRRLLAYTGASAAAAAAAGVALDRLAFQREATPGASAALTLPDGKWVRVADVADVKPGQAMRFSAGAVEGFVVNTDGRISALSAVCTHMGCILRFNAQQDRLDCPCHGASFSLDGSPINREYLTSLTQLTSRVSGSVIQVKVDPSA